MAIYSLNIRSVGRKTHAAGAAGAHVRYITRPDAASRIMGENMPLDPSAARSWLDGQEQADRANARVIDKLRIALPRELTPEQRARVLEDFCADLTGSRCAWMAVIHDKGKDARNPHAHVILRDRDVETGKRVMRMSDSARDRAKAGLEPNACEWVRQRWEHHANRALERAGCSERIDRRTLVVQRIDREPQIHEGPAVRAMAERGERPQSQERERSRSAHHPKPDPEPIRYPEIDQGRTRAERNAEIIDLNREREARRRAEQERQEEARRQEQAERAAATATQADRGAKAAREAALFQKALDQQAERERRDQAERHARERQALATEQTAREADQAQQKRGLASRLLDRINPARVRERERAERERQERERRQREALERRQADEREQLRREQTERAQARVKEFRRHQEQRQQERSRSRSGMSLEPRGRGCDGAERERPGRDDER